MDKENQGSKSVPASQKHTPFEFSEELDREHLLMIYEDDLERASAIFEIFLNGIEKEMQELNDLMKDNNTAEFLRRIHKLAPNFAMVGLTSATEELFEIEKTGKASGLTQLLRERFARFSELLEMRLCLVKNELNSIKNYLEQ